MNSTTSNILSLNRLSILFFYSDDTSLHQIKNIESHVKGLFPAADFLKINVRANPKVSISFHVGETPVVLILQDGKEIWRQNHDCSENALQKHLDLMKAQE